MRFFWVMPMLGMVHSFLFTGKWVMQSKQNLQFIVEPSKIVMTNREIGSRVSMQSYDWEWDNDAYHNDLFEFHVEIRPIDWFNLRKYARHIAYIEKIKKHGIHVRAIILDKDRIEIHARISSETLQPFCLVRQ